MLIELDQIARKWKEFYWDTTPLSNGQQEQDDLDLQRKEKNYNLYKSIQN